MLSIAFEVLFSCIDDYYYVIWQWVCFRYIFLLYLGWFIAKNGVVINITTVLLSLFSVCCILWFQYSEVTFEPIFYDNPWRIFHWPVYFYVSYLLVYALSRLYYITPEKIKEFVLLMGKYSYEIFLFQMLVFFISDHGVRSILVSDSHVLSYLYMILVTLICIVPVVLFYKKKNESI